VCVFFGIGIAGALAYGDVLQGPVTGTCARQQLDPSVNCANDLLQVLTQTQTEPAFWRDHAWSNSLLSLSVYLFPIASVVSSIPIFSIVIKYNLIENGFSNTAGFAWGVLFPWMLAFPLLYMPNALAQFLNYTSLTFVTFTDFIVPLALYIKLQHQRSERVDLSENNSVLGQELVDEGIHAHYAFPRKWGLSPGVKISLAWIIAAFLAMSAMVAGVLTVQQGEYTFNMQVCALVGN
jgi:hypothetical protein